MLNSLCSACILLNPKVAAQSCLVCFRLNKVVPLLALQGYGGDAVALRLRKTLVRIANQSLVQFKPAIIASRPAHVPTGQSVMLSAL